jgi:selenide,water dikinase
MSETEKELVTKNMIKGFNDCANEAGAPITGGQSVLNPWPMIGGVANVVCNEDEYIKVNQAVAGDKIVLTKPIGTQVAVNLNEWFIEKNAKYLDKALEFTNAGAARDAYYLATESMGTLNMNASGLMNKHKCHGATDITGFGIKGHADNLVQV